MEFIFSLLENTSVIIVIATIMIIAFSKCITKIFRMGVTFKADLATKAELNDFEAEIRRDMRGYAIQIQKSVIDAVMIVINNKFKDVDDMKSAALDIKVIKAEIEMELKNISAKTAEIQDVSNTVRSLNNRVQRLEFNNSQTVIQNSTNRRSEN